MNYVNKETRDICSIVFLARKAGVRINYKTVIDDAFLARVDTQEVLDDNSGQVGTTKCEFRDGAYYRVYRDYTAEELVQQAAQAAEAAKLAGVEFEGVMCSAQAEDMWGLASVRSWVVAGNTVPFKFNNGNVVTLSNANLAAFEAVWIPFRASFFV